MPKDREGLIVGPAADAPFVDVPAGACLVRVAERTFASREAGGLQVQVDRLELPAWGRTPQLSSHAERALILREATGAVLFEGASTQWETAVNGLTIAWIPPGCAHAFRSTCDVQTHGLLVSVEGTEPKNDASGLRPGAEVVEPGRIPARCMVSFLTRTLMRKAPPAGRLRLCEMQTLLPGGYVPSHAHDGHCEICYVLCGRGAMRLGGDDGLLEAGQIALIPPGLSHGATNPAKDVLQYVILQFDIMS
ncbi:MAG: cupin domain-containing protein [Candidatus Bipolaricaulis sp.]|nr:cupin domain-containing protein [Candidatus Bipolaricaulis sp.]